MTTAPVGSKRKTLHDYFGHHDGRLTKKPATCGDAIEVRSQTKIFEQPLGLSLIPMFVTAPEETSLLQFLDGQQWRTDLARRTMHYGGTYCLMPPRDAAPDIRKKIEETIITAPNMPPELEFVIQRMIDQGLYSADQRPEYCIVNEYLPGQGISAHVENFRFDEPVCSLTLAGADTMRFHELVAANDGSVRSGKASAAPRTGNKRDILLTRQSLVVLRGDARSKWQHEIVRGRKASKPMSWRRVSLTFRVEKNHGHATIVKDVNAVKDCNGITG